MLAVLSAESKHICEKFRGRKNCGAQATEIITALREMGRKCLWQINKPETEAKFRVLKAKWTVSDDLVAMSSAAVFYQVKGQTGHLPSIYCRVD